MKYRLHSKEFKGEIKLTKVVEDHSLEIQSYESHHKNFASELLKRFNIKQGDSKNTKHYVVNYLCNSRDEISKATERAAYLLWSTVIYELEVVCKSEYKDVKECDFSTVPEPESFIKGTIFVANPVKFAYVDKECKELKPYCFVYELENGKFEVQCEINFKIETN